MPMTQASSVGLKRRSGPRYRRVLAALLFFLPVVSTGDEDPVERFTEWFLEHGEALEDVRFAEVVEAATDHKVLPVDPAHPADARLLVALERALDRVLATLADPDHPIHAEGRVNEISRHIEDALREALSGVDGLDCEPPRTEAGDVQRSGYPDLRLEDRKSGRVFYLDPKVYKVGSETSSFRTFYFEPKDETNKILDDASHLIIGVPHGGKVEARWILNGWRVVDLSSFRVRLKAEFQASNRAIYRESATVLRSAPAGK